MLQDWAFPALVDRLGGLLSGDVGVRSTVPRAPASC